MPFIFQILAYTERIAEKVKYGILMALMIKSVQNCDISLNLQTLYQLHWENCLLKEENNTLIKVLAKIKK